MNPLGLNRTTSFRVLYKNEMDASHLAHSEGRYNQAIDWARRARVTAMYALMLPINHQMVNDATALISLNYRTMREMGIN